MLERVSAASDQRHKRSKSLSSLGTHSLYQDERLSWSDVHNIVEKGIEKPIDILDDWMISVAEQTVIDAVETCCADFVKEFIKAAFESALNGLSVSLMDNSFEIWESIEDAVIQVAATLKTLTIIAAAML